MERFLKETKKLKKVKASELAGIIFEYQDDIISSYIKRGHTAKFKGALDELFVRMKNEKFPAALKKILKKAKKDESVKLDCGFAVVINAFIEFNAKAENKVDEDIISEYTEIIEKLLNKPAKKLAKEVDVPVDVVREVMVIAPSKDYISNDKFVGLYSQRMLRKLYMLSANPDTPVGLTTTKQVKKLFTRLFGKDLLDLIAINILLEKKEFLSKYNETQVTMWNLFTQFAVEIVESQDKKHIIELIKYYANRRARDDQSQHDAARRISLSGLPAEDYPKIAKAVAKCKENQKVAKYI